MTHDLALLLLGLIVGIVCTLCWCAVVVGDNECGCPRNYHCLNAGCPRRGLNR